MIKYINITRLLFYWVVFLLERNKGKRITIIVHYLKLHAP